MVILGHDFKHTGEVHGDHWEVKCVRCGFSAASDVSKQTVEGIEKGEIDPDVLNN